MTEYFTRLWYALMGCDYPSLAVRLLEEQTVTALQDLAAANRKLRLELAQAQLLLEWEKSATDSAIAKLRHRERLDRWNDPRDVQ